MMKMIIQTKCPLLPLLVIVCALTLFACNNQNYSSPQGYDLNKGQKMELGKVLNEISGICYNNDDQSLLAISDSKKKVFRIDFKKQALDDFTADVIGPDNDLEDIVKVESSLFLLSSRGVIYEVPTGAKDSTGVKAYPFWSQEQNDFETIYYDPTINSLVILCKECAPDKGKQMRSAYRFDLAARSFDTTVFYSISTADVKKMVKDDNAKFDPSAAAIHPENKRLYILSSAGNLLVVTDTHGKVVETYQLNPDFFPQAEGIAFAQNGDMYISNEGKYGKPTLQIFRYEKGKKN